MVWGAPICALKGCSGPRPYGHLPLCCDPLQAATIEGTEALQDLAWWEFPRGGWPSSPSGAPQAHQDPWLRLLGASWEVGEVPQAPRVKRGASLSHTPEGAWAFLPAAPETEWTFHRGGRGKGPGAQEWGPWWQGLWPPYQTPARSRDKKGKKIMGVEKGERE